MNCREFNIEFEETRLLSETAALHKRDCPNCAKLHTEQTRVWQMIDALPHVEAPKDFNFRLQAKIANANPRSFQPAWWTSLRYVAPVFTLALILTLVFAGQNFFVSTPDVAENNVANPVIEQVQAGSPPIDERINNFTAPEPQITPETARKAENNLPKSAEKEQVILASRKPEKSAVPRTKFVKNKEVKAGSLDTALTVPKNNYFPNGVSPNSNTEQSQNVQNSTTITPAQSLSELGISTEMKEGKREVVSIRKGSVAELSGVKVGDVIQNFNGKKFTIIRGEETIEINLRLP